MYDRFKRHISYLRISVTDRCNLRCTYCMPAEGIKLISHSDILSFEEIVEVVKAGVSIGITKIRLTGGEPLVRRDIVKLVGLIAGVDGVKEISMTTNGILLKQFAMPLKLAGLNRINISLDTFDGAGFSEITRGGNIEKVFEGIRAAKDAGLQPIKINCVKKPGEDNTPQKALIEFCKINELQLRFISLMSLPDGEFSVVEGGTGGDCENCDRLRLTSNGFIKPCLFGEEQYNIRELGALKAMKMAISNKPFCGTFNRINEFYNIGG